MVKDSRWSRSVLECNSFTMVLALRYGNLCTQWSRPATLDIGGDTCNGHGAGRNARDSQ